MNLGRDFLDHLLSDPSSVSTSFWTVKRTSKKKKTRSWSRSFFFAWPANVDIHTHLSLAYRKWSLGTFLSSFSVGCKKNGGEREREKNGKKRKEEVDKSSSVCCIEKEEASSRHTNSPQGYRQEKETASVCVLETCGIIIITILLGFLLMYKSLSFHNSPSQTGRTPPEAAPFYLNGPLY